MQSLQARTLSSGEFLESIGKSGKAIKMPTMKLESMCDVSRNERRNNGKKNLTGLNSQNSLFALNSAILLNV
jgi:hypothetical protein